MKGYIYKITNLVNGKTYIGQTTRDPKARWQQHIWGSSHKGSCKALYAAFKKYGIDVFSFEVIAEVDRPLREEMQEILDNLEIEYIKYYDSINGGYNIEGGGKGHPTRKYVYIELNDEGEIVDLHQGCDKQSDITALQYCSELEYGRMKIPAKGMKYLRYPNNIDKAISKDLVLFDDLCVGRDE